MNGDRRVREIPRILPREMKLGRQNSAVELHPLLGLRQRFVVGGCGRSGCDHQTRAGQRADSGYPNDRPRDALQIAGKVKQGPAGRLEFEDTTRVFDGDRSSPRLSFRDGDGDQRSRLTECHVIESHLAFASVFRQLCEIQEPRTFGDQAVLNRDPAGGREGFDDVAAVARDGINDAELSANGITRLGDFPCDTRGNSASLRVVGIRTESAIPKRQDLGPNADPVTGLGVSDEPNPHIGDLDKIRRHRAFPALDENDGQPARIPVQLDRTFPLDSRVPKKRPVALQHDDTIGVRRG